MGTENPIPTQDKQVTVAVPEDRVPEFYAFYARFLAGSRPGGRRGRRGGPGRHGPGRHGCRSHGERTEQAGETAAPATGDAPPGHRRGHDGLMADKQITVAVPDDRVPEFYAWFAAFLAADRGAEAGPGPDPGDFGGPGFGGPGFGPRQRHTMRRRHADPEPWTAEDGKRAQWLLHKLAPPARALFDLLVEQPGTRFGGNDIAARLGLEKGAHGVAGILAWPGRYCRKIDRELPVRTEGRPDGGTDYYMEPEVAALFAVPPD